MNEVGDINLLVGLDDTDNAESRGTGYLARQLAHLLETSGLASVNGITRHQLFISPAIRYTSQNSSACINLNASDHEAVLNICEEYLFAYSADGADTGLCIAGFHVIGENIHRWGMKAKHLVLNMEEAYDLANKTGIYLQGLKGKHEGIIGALAAIGLHAGGNDGRFIWRRGIKELREMGSGIYNSNDLVDILALDDLCSINDERPGRDDRIAINEWVRPLLKDHRAVLIIEKTENQEEYEWKLSSKELIRSIS